MTIRAIRPTGAALVVHLHVPGYQPGKKPRGEWMRTLCGGHSSDRELVGLLDALEAVGHRARSSCPWRWCRPCLGHGAAVAGVEAAVVHLLLEQLALPLEGS